MNQGHSVQAHTQNVEQFGLLFTIDFIKKSAILISANQNSEKVLIPRYIKHNSQDFLVQNISKFAFRDSILLKSIKFSSDCQIQTIESNTFTSSSIQTVSISPCITKICEEAFSNCEKLRKIEIPTNSQLQTIERRAFAGSSIETITIPSSLTELKEGWWIGLPKLRQITVMKDNKKFFSISDKFLLEKSIPENENYDIFVFSVRNVESATIPDYVEVIGANSFDECQKLETIEFSRNSKLRVIGQNAFSETSIKNIRIPSTVTKICDSAFTNCIQLQNVEIPANSELKIIEKDAFAGSAIENFSIPNKVIQIGERAFSECWKLDRVDIPSNSELRTIEEKTFFCSGIKNIKISPKITKICKSAFSNCYYLQNVEFETNSELQIIENDAFSCSSITCISLPSRLRQIGNCVFIYCNKLQIVEFEENSEIEKVDANIVKYCINPTIMMPQRLLKQFSESSLNQSSDDDARENYSEVDSIQNFYRKKSINLLQNTIDLEQIELDYIKNEVNSFLSKQKLFKNWSFIFANQSLFEEAEKQVRSDIQNNAFEMIIIGQTIIANKYFAEYNTIKRRIPSNNVIERFLYHGSRLSNHQKIVKMHFLMPGQDKVKQLDKGYYGKGIYATENMFYASVYGKGFSVLNINEKTSIICCRVIYNSTKVNHLEELSYGQAIIPDIANNYGVNHALVGSNNKFKPITNDERENSLIVAEEFVFPQKYQIIPICSFTVMRTDYFILWKDEHIENNENSQYMKDLSKKLK